MIAGHVVLHRGQPFQVYAIHGTTPGFTEGPPATVHLVDAAGHNHFVANVAGALQLAPGCAECGLPPGCALCQLDGRHQVARAS